MSIPPTGWNIVVWKSLSMWKARYCDRPERMISARGKGWDGTPAPSGPPPGGFSKPRRSLASRAV